MVSDTHTFPSAVIFDLDGTLIDSAPDLHAALNRLMASEGRRRLELQEVIMMIGDGVPKLVERGFGATGEIPEGPVLEERVRQFSEDYEKRATELTTVFPGVREALDVLTRNQVPMGICTNKPQRATLEVLRFYGLTDRFSAVVGGDQLGGVRKPDPKHLIATLDILRVEPKKAVMVGDSPNDIKVAQNAGVPSVAVSFGYTRIPVGELGAGRIIDHFRDLAEALQAVSNPA